MSFFFLNQCKKVGISKRSLLSDDAFHFAGLTQRERGREIERGRGGEIERKRVREKGREKKREKDKINLFLNKLRLKDY